jgi:hypothetical protein
MHSLVHEHYVRAQVAERLAACEQGRKWRRWRQQPSQTPPPRPPGRGGGPFASGVGLGGIARVSAGTDRR